jgi:hypothetical protein
VLGARAVPSALAIGSIIPDAWYFVPSLDRGHSHDALGVLWFCLPAGLIAYAAFHLIFKQPMLALLPRDLAGRLAAWCTHGLPAIPPVWVLVSLLAGIATHLAWDAFTHPGYLAALEAEVLSGMRLHRILQHASTLLGTALLVAWLWRKLQGTKPRPVVEEIDVRLRAAVLGAMIVFPAIAFFVVFDSSNVRTMLRAGGVTALSAFGLLALLFAVAWRLWRSQKTSSIPTP